MGIWKMSLASLVDQNTHYYQLVSSSLSLYHLTKFCMRHKRVVWVFVRKKLMNTGNSEPYPSWAYAPKSYKCYKWLDVLIKMKQVYLRADYSVWEEIIHFVFTSQLWDERSGMYNRKQTTQWWTSWGSVDSEDRKAQTVAAENKKRGMTMNDDMN